MLRYLRTIDDVTVLSGSSPESYQVFYKSQFVFDCIGNETLIEQLHKYRFFVSLGKTLIPPSL